MIFIDGFVHKWWYIPNHPIIAILLGKPQIFGVHHFLTNPYIWNGGISHKKRRSWPANNLNTCTYAASISMRMLDTRHNEECINESPNSKVLAPIAWQLLATADRVLTDPLSCGGCFLNYRSSLPNHWRLPFVEDMGWCLWQVRLRVRLDKVLSGGF